MSADGSTLVVGAFNATVGANVMQGAVYVYNRQADHRFGAPQQLLASDGAAQDLYGTSVAVSADGGTVVVGNGTFSASVPGAAYVYTRSGGVFGSEQRLSAMGGAALNHYGVSVAISGDASAIAVGAYGTKVGLNASQGAVYYYTRSGGVYGSEQKIVALNGMTTDGKANDQFGASVALNSDASVLAVGAKNRTVTVSMVAHTGQGAAYAYIKSGGIFSSGKRLLSSDGASGDNFGATIAVTADGTTVAIGAPFKKVGVNGLQGEVYIYTQSGGAFTANEQQHLTASDGASPDEFGISLALSGDSSTVAVGAKGKTVGANTTQGQAYIYSFSAGSYTNEQRLTASDGAGNDFFGGSIALNMSGSDLLIGAYQKTVGVKAHQGAVYHFSPVTRFALSATDAMNAPVATPTNNVPFTLTVTALASDGGTIPGYTGTITLSTGPGVADIAPASGHTFTGSGMGADNGVFAFTVTPRTAGPLTLTVTDSFGVSGVLPLTVATVLSGITKLDADPTNAASVRWQVEFASPVTGLTAGDFVLTPAGVSGASITGVTASGTTVTVTARTGRGTGTLGLSYTGAANDAQPPVHANVPVAGPLYILRPAPSGTSDHYAVIQNAALNTATMIPGVLANDTSSVSGDMLSAALVPMSGPDHAQAFTFHADGSFQYTSAGAFVGDDRFQYTPVSSAGVPGAPVTVTITVNATTLVGLTVTAPIGPGTGNTGSAMAVILRPGEALPLTVSGAYDNGTSGAVSGVSYHSSDPTIASVDVTTGRVTAIAPGTATITAVSPNSVQATITITVTAPQGAGLINPNPLPASHPVSPSGATMVVPQPEMHPAAGYGNPQPQGVAGTVPTLSPPAPQPARH